MLGDSMAANNSCKAVDITSLPLKSATSPCVSPSRACHAAVSKPSVMDMDLLGLTDKMHNVQTRENQLKDLLEAKAMALSQADRLISQYRFRKTQSEAQ
uniref:Protein CIP2A-like n=1 Tax=Saccoglossus kowalevskii TaxID=10224 RepID=A0ABM0MMM4_SACKO